ncbi:unnamed protein product [Dracunculus medinensis]|uniref:BHLH domain-containing protein n=1 Tax=Dracunculus medinensis TaxID=318479 RepID=A0A0N4U616_DRAME|nr:unnamed protein product [Dracunculus medinensis]
MNLAFAKLQQCVPHIPKDQKLPKIKTLRLAVRYIQHLEDILRGETTFQSSISATPRPLELEDFASVAMQEVQTRNNYKGKNFSRKKFFSIVSVQLRVQIKPQLN